MKKKQLIIVLFAAGIVLTLLAGTLLTGEGQPATSIIVRELKEQVVLYTIYRGDYSKSGAATGKLFALAGQKGMMPPAGPVEYAFLNNPKTTTPEHYLTEIRIPVNAEHLKLAGTLGEMTDIKKVAAGEAVVAVKPEGVANPEPIYKELMTWLFRNGCVATDAPREIYLTNAMSGDYASMKTEILIPFERFGEKKAPATTKP
ncbi:MAG: GyrI-like domain-containing protein [Sedimentisphaerales bacterium]|nr:GyrI-like domain-containing protein [Sedimentisphaerales bacterium]